MESLVRLTVKTPNQGIEDIQINCDLDWTVRKLKEYLQDVYPSKPSSSSQRLIYLGRLLQDHLSLKEVFGVSSYLTEWGARTVHIVCNETTETMATTTASSTMATSTTNSVSAANTPGMDGLRFRGYTSPQGLPSNQPFMGATTMTSSMFPQYMSAVGHTPPGHTPPVSSEFHQMQAQLAQQYQQQMQLYYQQWHQWQQTMGGGQWPYNQYVTSTLPTPPNTPITTSPVPSLSPQPLPDQQQQQPQPQQPEVVPNQANQNMRMNAGPGGVGMQDDDDDNENPRNRDWLDWLYTSLRAFMLLSIVYFYSSTSRFIMVTILAFLLYLYQNGWFTPRRVPLPGVGEEVHIQDEINDAHDDINGQQNNSEQGDNNDNNSTDQPPIPNEPPRPSPFRMLCTFFVSFVTSLIPNPPAIPQQ